MRLLLAIALQLSISIFGAIPSQAQMPELNSFDRSANKSTQPVSANTVLFGTVREVDKWQAESKNQELVPGKRLAQPLVRLTPQQAQPGSSKPPTKSLSGTAVRDYDLENREVMIEWDRWRNRFDNTVYNKFHEIVGSNSIAINGSAPQTRFPNGTKATVECKITNTGQIQNIRITNFSGNDDFDSIVMQSVQALSGSSILKFPTASRRQSVSEYETLWIGTNTGFHESTYGDIERYKSSNAVTH